LALSLFASILVIAQPSFALLCVEDCIPEPPPPPEPPPGCQYSLGAATILATGTVKNSLGNPVSGVKVYNWCKSATTNSSGFYSILVPIDDPGPLTAKHSLYLHISQSLQTPVGTSPINFDGNRALPFLVNAQVTPDAFNALSDELTFTIDTTAPTSAMQPIFQIPAAAPLELFHDLTYTTPAGWSRWSLTTTMPAGFPRGRQTLYACVIKASAADGEGCISPASADLVSQVRDYAAAYDQTPPARISSVPAAFTNVTAAPQTISVTIGDSGGAILASGVFPTRLDGQSAAATRSGDTISISGAGLQPGVHLVEIDAADTAGNAATVAHFFAVTTLSGSPASAHLTEQTVPVDADGFARFSPNAATDLFTLSLSGSARVGHGGFHRAFGFAAPSVVFTRSDGQQQTVVIAAISGQTTHHLAVLAPSDQTLTATLAQQAVNLPQVQVAAPAGFTADGTTATLQPAATDLGSVTPAAAIMLDEHLTGSIPVTMIIARCTTLTAACSIGGITNRVVANLPGAGWVPVPVGAVLGQNDPDTSHASQDPGCEPLEPESPDQTKRPCGQVIENQDIENYVCPTNAPALTPTVTGCGQSNLGVAQANGQADYARASLVIGCAPSLPTGGQNLCTGSGTPSSDYARLFDHLFAYADPGCQTQPGQACSPTTSPSSVGIWLQSHAMVDQGSCPNGFESGQVTGILNGLATNFQPDSESSLPPYNLEAVATTDKFNAQGELTGNRTEWGAEMGRSNSQGDGTSAPTEAWFRVRHFLPPSAVPPGTGAFKLSMDSWTTIDGTRTTDSRELVNGIVVKGPPADVATSWYEGESLVPSEDDPKELEMFSGAVLSGVAPAVPVAHTHLLAFVTLDYACE